MEITVKGGTWFRPSLLWTLLIAALTAIIGALSLIWFTTRAISSPQDASVLAGLNFYGTVPEFSLIERSGRALSLSDLRGKVWILNFAYTRCTETCPLQTAQMARLQTEFRNDPEIRFVSISADPEYDTPEILFQYANQFNADPERWFFLTGAQDAIQRLAIEGFRLGLFENPREEIHIHADGTQHIHPTPIGEAIAHSSRFVLVDQDAHIRGYYQSTDDPSLRQLRRDVKTLLLEKKSFLPIAALPNVNASLNAITAILLSVAYVFIRQRKITAHRTCMLSAFALSALFLLSYATYHFYAGFTPFEGQGWIRVFYFAVLIPHVILAAVIVPLALVVLRRGLNRWDSKHKRLARWTLPLWIYTSVTGVVVYLMLYQLY